MGDAKILEKLVNLVVGIELERQICCSIPQVSEHLNRIAAIFRMTAVLLQVGRRDASSS